MPSELKTGFEYIQFEERPCAGKTKIWLCFNKRLGGSLGVIKWFPHWRQYCFFPSESIFSAGCLRDIASFIDAVMLQRKVGIR